MLTWGQSDILNEIAKNGSLSADQRKAAIVVMMREWGELAHSMPTIPTNHALFADHEKSVIDPSKEATKAKMPLPGQTGRTYYPGI